MLTKFHMESVRTATTPYEAAKSKLKDETVPPVNVHLYRSMIGSLMYLTASRPDIMFAVSACSRHQVTPLTSHLNAVKKIFKYLKGQPKLGLWYPQDSPFQLEAYSDSDYAGSHRDRKSTTGGCQFLGRRLISWQCKKQTIVATSSTEAEYVAAASCCAQVLWIQNQLLDYGFNFMNTKIFIDNQSTICIVKNPVFHQRTKHIEIRHHFIRDANEKNLIQVLKIHTNDNVADLLTKAFDGPRFEYLVVHIGMVVNTAASCTFFPLTGWLLLPRPYGYVDPDFVEPIIFGPQPRPDNYLKPEDLDNIISMEDDTTHGGFHVESPIRPDDAPTPTADAAGRAEDLALLTGLSAKLDRCMGRIDSLETELGKSKKIMGGAILTLVSRVKKLEKTVKQLRETRLVVDASAAEGDVDIQDDIDLDGLSRMASTALGHDQPAVPSEDVEEQEEEEVPLRHKRSAYRRARTEFSPPSFEQFQANLSAGVLPHTAVPEPAGPSVAADKGKSPMPDLDIPAEFLAEDAQARKCFEEEQASERLVQRLRAEDLAQEDLPNVSEERAKELDDLMMRMTETDWLTLMMQVGSNPALARELLGADVNEENFIERMNAVKEKKKRALADLRYRALKGKPMKKSEVTQMMRNLVKNQWCAAHNGTITMKDPAITEPPSKRQRVERVSSQPASVPAATTLPADDPDSAGGGSSNPAGSATPMAGSAASNTAGGAFGATVTDSTVTTTAAMDSAGSRRKIGVSPFADSAAGPSPFLSSIAGGPSPSNVSTDQIPIAVLFESTSGAVMSFSLKVIRRADLVCHALLLDPDSDDEVLLILSLGSLLLRDGELWRLLGVHNVNGIVSSKDVVTPTGSLFPPVLVGMIVVAGNIIQTVQAGLRQAYESIASAPIACTARQMVFSSPWLTAKKEFGSPLPNALLASPEQTATVHAVSFDAAVLDVASTVSAACIVVAGYIVSAGIWDAAGSFVLAVFIYICCLLCFCCYSILLLREDLSRNLELTESKPMASAGSSSSVPADYVPAGHVLISADRYRIC
ncbi:hypothetical protein Tco_0898096 [Tanacetum coccineum]